MSEQSFNSPTLRVGSWNLKVGRDRVHVFNEVAALLALQDLDVLVVQEAAWYADHLARLVGYDYYTTRGRRVGDRDAGILVRHGLRVRGYRLERTFTRWPRRKYPERGAHWPRSFPSVVVEGIRIMSVHMPPGPHTGRTRRAYAEGILRIMWRLRGRRPMAAPGDYNKRPNAHGAFTPMALAQALNARLIGSTIDLLIVRRCRVSDYRRGPSRGSDHAPVLFDLTRQEARR